MKHPILKPFMVVIVFMMITTITQAAKPQACQGVSKKCTKDVRFDKTIEGQAYSCYECKQTVCKAGGSGSIAGTETSTVCESKAPTGRALSRSLQTLQFDEADAIFGSRSEVKDAHPSIPKTAPKKTDRNKNTNTVDHRENKASNISKNRERGTQRKKIPRLNPPTNVTLYDVTKDQLRISWIDNNNDEYGVSVERGIPQNDRGGINYNWQHVFNVEERMDNNVKGTGWRTDGDDGLSSNTQYCYRLRAYHQAYFSAYSSKTCMTTSQ